MSTLFDVNSTDSPTPAFTEHQHNSIATTSTKTTFTVSEIQKLLPHRYPFAMVDRIIDYIPRQRAVGIKNITFNEPYFQGHFPGQPIMPGVMIVEAMAQVGGVVLSQLPEMEGVLFLFAGINKARFRRQVVPGDQLVMTVELSYVRHGHFFSKMQARAEVDGHVAAEGELLFSGIFNLSQP